MKFKVGDKVIAKKQVTEEELATLSIPYYLWKGVSMGVFTISKLSAAGNIKLKEEALGLWFNPEWFELADQTKPIEPQVGDVWGNVDKSEVVRVLGKFERYGLDFVSYFGLKGECKVIANFVSKQTFLEKLPILLQRKPKKQPKQVAETPKKQKEEEKWEPVVGQGIDSTRCFRKGNSIKWVQNDCEGIATCNKKDTFDLLFGIDLAWYRAEIKCHEAKIAEMLKEGAK